MICFLVLFHVLDWSLESCRMGSKGGMPFTLNRLCMEKWERAAKEIMEEDIPTLASNLWKFRLWGILAHIISRSKSASDREPCWPSLAAGDLPPVGKFQAFLRDHPWLA